MTAVANLLVAYVPVLSENYIKFFEGHRGAWLWVVSEEILSEFQHLRKDLRALKSEQAARAIRALDIFSRVDVARPADLEDMKSFTSDGTVVMPDEEECRVVAERYLRDVQVVFEPVFLRYDRKRAIAETQVFADFAVTEEEAHHRFMDMAASEAQKSPDWWRQVGAVAVKGNEVIFVAYNTTVPTGRETLYHGDPRANFKAGVEIEASLIFHAEAAIVAVAACQGVGLEGAILYVTTFPCAPCAKLVAYSGFKEVYFRDGYSRTDGQEVLRDKGVKIVRVEAKAPESV